MNRKQKKERLQWLNHGQAKAAAENKRVALLAAAEAEAERLEAYRRRKAQARWDKRVADRIQAAKNRPKTSTGEW